MSDIKTDAIERAIAALCGPAIELTNGPGGMSTMVAVQTVNVGIRRRLQELQDAAKSELSALRARVERGEQDGGIVLTCGHRVRDLADGIYVHKKDTGATCQPATSHEIVCARCYNWALELGLVLRTPDEEDAYLGAASSPSPESSHA